MTRATPTKRKMTAEEFWQLCADGKPRELVRGEVVEKMPVGTWRAITASFIDYQLRKFLEGFKERIGVVATELGFVIRYADEDSVRAPDAASFAKSVYRVRAGDTLTCEAILPGFALPVNEIFAELE